MLRSDAAKRVMLNRLAETGRYRFWPVWSLLTWLGDQKIPRLPLPWNRSRGFLPRKGSTLRDHIPAIVGSIDESFRLLMEICDLPEVSRTDFVIRRGRRPRERDRRVGGGVRNHASCQKVSSFVRGRVAR